MGFYQRLSAERFSSETLGGRLYTFDKVGDLLSVMSKDIDLSPKRVQNWIEGYDESRMLTDKQVYPDHQSRAE